MTELQRYSAALHKENTSQRVGNKAKGRISKRTFLTRMCAYQRVRNVRFFGKFGVLCFLETPVLRFVLLPH